MLLEEFRECNVPQWRDRRDYLVEWPRSDPASRKLLNNK